jgi:hypothetical protein
MEGLLTSTSFAWYRLPFPGVDDDIEREKRMFKLLLETSVRITIDMRVCGRKISAQAP